MFLARRRSPREVFRGFLGRSEPHSCILHFRGLASCGRNSRFTGFLGVRGLREISQPPGAQSGPKMPQKRMFPVLGPFWAKCAPTKFDRLLSADPVNSCLGPHVSFRPQIWPVWGVPTSLFSSKFERFWPQAPPMMAGRTEKA